MKAIALPPQSQEQLVALDELYHSTKDVRLRTRAQMMLLAAEQKLVAPEIAGLRDAPRPGAETKVTAEYEEKMLTAVRRRPRSLELPFSMWTLQRLVDYLAEETGIRVSDETVRLHLAAHDIVLSRPQHKISSPDPDYVVKKRRLKSHETV